MKAAPPVREVARRLAEVAPPPAPVRVVVERTEGFRSATDAEDDGSFTIRLHHRLTPHEAQDALIHEWAHVHHRCDDDDCAHDDNWGRCHARIYRGYHGEKHNQPVANPEADLTVRSVAGGLRALEHPAVVAQHKRSLRYKPRNRSAVLIPCSALKPYFESPSHKHGYIPALQGKQIDVFVVSEPMGVIPYSWADTYPNNAYEFAPKYVRGETRELLVSRIRQWLEKVGRKYDKVYLALPIHHMKMVQDAGVGLALSLVDVSISRCREQPDCPPTAFRATSEAYRDFLRRKVRNPNDEATRRKRRLLR